MNGLLVSYIFVSFCISFNDQGVVSLYFGPASRNIEQQVFTWACISVDGPRVIQPINEKFDTKTYIGLLVRHVLPDVSIQSLYVHDHFPVHKARAVELWARQQFFLFPSWPPKSGDLMPLTTLFSKIVTNINNQKVPIHSKEKLLAEVERHFSLICQDDEYVTQLIDSMPEKIKAIILNGGDEL